MKEKSFKLDPSRRISLKTLSKKVLTEVRDSARVGDDDLRVGGSDLDQELVQSFGFVRRSAEQTLVQDYSNRPEIIYRGDLNPDSSVGSLLDWYSEGRGFKSHRLQLNFQMEKGFRRDPIQYAIKYGCVESNLK